VDHGQRRAQLVRDVGHEVAADLFQAQQLAHVTGDQQPVIGRVGNQAQVEPDRRIDRGGHVQDRFGIAAAGQPVRQRHRLQALDQRLAEVAGVVQAEQRGGRFVEPLHALAVAVHHHHRIGQRGGGRTVAAQHVQQAPLARAHLQLVAIQQAVQFVPHSGAVAHVPAMAGGQPAQHPAQPPVVPGQRTDRGQCDAHPHMPGEQAQHTGRQQQEGEGGQCLQPGGADVARHCGLAESAVLGRDPRL